MTHNCCILSRMLLVRAPILDSGTPVIFARVLSYVMASPSWRWVCVEGHGLVVGTSGTRYHVGLGLDAIGFSARRSIFNFRLAACDRLSSSNLFFSRGGGRQKPSANETSPAALSRPIRYRLSTHEPDCMISRSYRLLVRTAKRHQPTWTALSDSSFFFLSLDSLGRGP